MLKEAVEAEEDDDEGVAEKGEDEGLWMLDEERRLKGTEEEEERRLRRKKRNPKIPRGHARTVLAQDQDCLGREGKGKGRGRVNRLLSQPQEVEICFDRMEWLWGRRRHKR